MYLYLTVILRGRAGYELIYITNDAAGRVGYYQLIPGKSEKNNCLSKFSSNSQLISSGETSANRDIRDLKQPRRVCGRRREYPNRVWVENVVDGGKNKYLSKLLSTKSKR